MLTDADAIHPHSSSMPCASLRASCHSSSKTPTPSITSRTSIYGSRPPLPRSPIRRMSSSQSPLRLVRTYTRFIPFVSIHASDLRFVEPLRVLHQLLI